MRTRGTLRTAAPVAVLGLMAFSLAWGARWGPGPARAGSADPIQQSAKVEAPSADEKAVLALDEAFVRAYDKGDAKALAALFTEDAEVEEDSGEVYQGREAVEAALAASFAEDRGARLTLEIDSVRFVTPDVARETGRSVVTPTAGAPVSRLYTVLYVKRDGQWRISSVREEPDPMVPPRERLKDLEWMVGHWVDEGSDALVKLDCRWSDDGNFLLRSFEVRHQGKAVQKIDQRIGWDPLVRQFRSWDFDSDGGFGEGRWSRDGTSWVVHHSGVRPEGTPASATNVLTRVGPDLIRWRSTVRVLGGQVVPDDQEYALARVAPAPHAPAPSPETRRPR